MNRLRWIRQVLVAGGLVLALLAIGIARVEATYNCTTNCNTETCSATTPTSAGGPGCQTGACTGNYDLFECADATHQLPCGCGPATVIVGGATVTVCSSR